MPQTKPLTITNIIIAITIFMYIVQISIDYGTIRMGLNGYFLEGLWYQPLSTMFAHGGIGHLLMNMFVLYQFGNLIEEYRGKGIGKKLVEQAIEGMKIKKCNESYLEVRTDNIPAIKLYENLGFNRIAMLNTYYKDGKNAFLMSAKLNRNN